MQAGKMFVVLDEKDNSRWNRLAQSFAITVALNPQSPLQFRIQYNDSIAGNPNALQPLFVVLDCLVKIRGRDIEFAIPHRHRYERKGNL